MSTAPSKLPRWATSPGAGMPGNIEPPEAKKDAGFVNGEEPAAGNFNWLLNLQYQWLEFLAPRSHQSELQALSGAQLIDQGIAEDLNAVAGDNNSYEHLGVLVAAGAGGKIRRRSGTQNATWTTMASAGGYTGVFRAACYDFIFNAFVVAGDGMQLQTLTTGSFQARVVENVNAADTFAQLVSNNSGIIIAVSPLGSNRVANSATGTLADWRDNSTHDGVAGGPTRVAFGNGRFVSTQGWTSVDGSSWATHGSPIAAVRIVYSSYFGFVGIASSGAGVTVYTSPDGVVWQQRLASGRLRDPANARLVTVGRNVFHWSKGDLGFWWNTDDSLTAFVWVPWNAAAFLNGACIWSNRAIYAVGDGGRIYAGPPLAGY